MATMIVDPPVPSAPASEWQAYVSKLEDLLDDKPDDPRLSAELARAREWAASTVFDYNPYHVSSGEHGGRFTSGPASGAEDPEKKKNKIVLLSPVLKRAELIEPNAGKSVDELRAEAVINQEALEKLGRDLEAKTGIEFAPPPPGFGVKTMASLQRKIQDEGYAGAHEITDISRASFLVESPQQAQTVLDALSEHGRIYDKGWSKLEEFGYGDRKLYLRHANDGVSEIQIVPKAIAQLKLNEGHKLYEIARVKSTPIDVVRAAKRKSRTLYNRALRASPFRSIFAKADG